MDHDEKTTATPRRGRPLGKMHPVTLPLRMSEEQHAALKQAAEREGRPVAEIVRRLIAAYLGGAG